MNPWRWDSNAYLNFDYCQRLNQQPLFYDDVEFKPFQGWTSYALKVDSIQSGVCSLEEVKTLAIRK